MRALENVFRVWRFNSSVELRIVPEPTPQERAAIAAALEEAQDVEARVVAAWMDPDFDAAEAHTPPLEGPAARE